jgi:hypothetical protein
MRAGVVLALLGLAGACATIPDTAAYRRAPDPGAGKVNVYVYRLGRWAACQNPGAPTMFVDGRPIYDMSENAYTVVRLPEGTHRLKVVWSHARCPEPEFYVPVEGGRSMYVKVSDNWDAHTDPDPGPGGAGGIELREIAEAEAEAELRRCCRFLPAHPLPANLSPAP